MIAAFVGWAVGEFGKAIAEPVNFEFYASDLGDNIFTVMTWVTVILLAVILRPKRSHVS
jgi:hypothetical protein